MARIRTIKPEFFRHEGLQDLEIANPGMYPMMVFEALWGHCDSKGRFEWKPRSLKLDILPFLPFDMAATLAILEAAKMIRRYTVDGKEYGLIDSFEKHQRLSGKEATEGEKYPQPPEEKPGSAGEIPESQEGKGREKEGKGREGKCVASASPILPDDEPRELTVVATPAGIVCARLRSVGISDVNPAHPKLLALLEAGLTADEIVAAGEEARKKAKGFAWILAAAEGRRRDAATIQPLPAKGDPPWWSSNETMIAKGKTFGLAPRPGEDWPQFRGRINEAIRGSEKVA